MLRCGGVGGKESARHKSRSAEEPSSTLFRFDMISDHLRCKILNMSPHLLLDCESNRKSVYTNLSVFMPLTECFYALGV